MEAFVSIPRIAKLCALAVALVSASGVTARAQSATADTFFTRVDFEKFALATDPHAVTMLDGARPLGFFEYAASMAMNMETSPLSLCVHNGSGACDPGGDLVSSRTSLDLGAVLGLGVADIRVVLPLVLSQFSDFSPTGQSHKLAAAGLADPQIGGRVALWSHEQFAVAGDLSFTIPFNEGSSFIGNTGATILPRVLGEMRQGRIAAVAGLGYLWRYKARQIGDLYVSDEIIWQLGGEYAILPGVASAGVALTGALGFMTNPHPMLATSSSAGQSERPVEGTLTGRYWILPKLAIQASLGRGLTGGYGAPAFRFVVGACWSDELPPVIVANWRPAPLPASAPSGDGHVIIAAPVGASAPPPSAPQTP
jgi:hypothetical protein